MRGSYLTYILRSLTIAKTYNQFYAILSAIKRCFSRSPIHRTVLNNTKTDEKGPKGGARYKCQSCGSSFGQREVQVDHIEPIVPIGIMSKDMSWDEIVNRTFCSEDKLQVLCTTCHKEKSKHENQQRKSYPKTTDGVEETPKAPKRSRKKAGQ